MYTQLVTPNLDPFIKEGGMVLNDWLGWCLAYAKTAYGAFGATGDTAWKAWNNTQFKHTDDVPEGVYVPVWFSGYGGMGHVAILYKRTDGQIQIWSSPISHKPYADVWGSIGEIERRYAVDYVGWSEDIAGVQVIKQGADVSTATIETLRISESEIRGGDLDFVHSGKFDAQMQAAYGGQDANKVVFDAWVAESSQKYRADKQTWKAFYAQYSETAPQMQAQIDTLTKANAILTKENESLKAQVGDATKWQTFKALLKELFN